jgi:hypothetical protein
LGGNEIPYGGNDIPLGGNDIPLGGNDIPLGGNGIMNGENESLSLLFLIRATNRGVFLLYKKLKAF